MTLAASVPLDSGFGGFLSFSALIFAVATCMIPLTTIRVIIQKKSTGTLPSAPYYAQSASCFTWALYGFVIKDNTAMIPNAIGTCLALSYLTTYHIFAPKETWMKLFVGDVVLCLIFAGLVGLLFMEDLVLQEKVIAGFAAGIYVFFLISPLVTMVRVVKEKTVDCLPFDPAFILFINSVIWVAYGYLVTNNSTVYGTSSLGLVVSVTQLFCHFAYGDFATSCKELCCGLCIRKKVSGLKTTKVLHQEIDGSEASSVETFEDKESSTPQETVFIEATTEMPQQDLTEKNVHTLENGVCIV